MSAVAFHEISIAVTAQNRVSTEFKRIQEDTRALGASFKDLAFKMSGVVTSGIALYGIWRSIESAQIAVAAGIKEVHETSVTLAEYQKRLNKLVAEGKTGTEEYNLVLKRIAVNEELLAVKKARLAMAQQDVTRAYIFAAATVIPSVITMIGSLKDAYAVLTAIKWGNVSATVAHSLAQAKAIIVTKLAAAATWILNASLAMKISLLTLGVGLIAATAAYMAWLASTTREAAAAQAEYNARLAETPTRYKSIRRAGEEEYYRRGVEA
jgi:hypothetical protein